MADLALLAAIIALIADGVTTAYAMRRGLVEVGPITSRLLGAHTSDWELFAWQLAKIAAAIAIWVYLPQYAAWILLGVAVPTLYISVRNVVRARRA